MRLPGARRVASGAVRAAATVLVACAVGFGIWATLTKNSAAFGRQTGLAGIYSLVLAVVVSAVAMTGWAVRRDRQPSPVLAIDSQLPRLAPDAGSYEDAPVVVGEIPQEPLGFQPREDLLAALGLVAWVNAEDVGGVLAGLAAIAAALDLGLGGGNAEAAGLAVRHRLEIDGDCCLLVFDNATDPAVLRPFIPAAGAAQVIITSNQESVANLGTGVPVEVFSEQDALTFLAERTGKDDAAGARALATELGNLPLALAQAAAVIAGQRLAYGTYLERLRAMPVGELLTPVDAGQYPRGVAAAVLLALDNVRAGDDTGACNAVMDLLAVLSPAGVRRPLVHAAGRQGVLGRDGESGHLTLDVVDKALARLAGTSLLTFSLDGSSVSAHRLVMRVIREQLAAGNSLVTVCEAAAQLLDAQAETLRRTWHEDRAAVRDTAEQIMALYESSAGCSAGSGIARRMIRLRWWAAWLLSMLGDSAAQSILIGEPLLADQERVLGADHPDTVASRNNLASAYQLAGRTAEAITLHEQTLADQERILGVHHPSTVASRQRLANAKWAQQQSRGTG